MNRDYCFRCSQYGHCSEDCPNFKAQMSRHMASFFAFVLRTAAILAIFFFLVGTVDYCAETYANDVTSSGSLAWNKN